jgi:hypothetical protein
MFGFLRQAGVRRRAAAVRCALEREGLPAGVETALALGVVEARGTSAGRRVTHVRVFDPRRAAARGLLVQRYRDLDTHRNLVLRTGHIEPDGAVVITWRAPLPDVERPVRAGADRGMRGDDERIAFAGTGARPGGPGP